ncbi:DUF2530 domain-containing protein [Agromyces mediolanus]|uniref:DUF2530 domain-containing protein n=1 Tax=Agromyces mediolanus TaxID=41986 RepID=UPI002041FD63|nr:DUF2530 domain-containing protein [Agromyces mediolanus]MCM3655850.1 DUF2530 domain-containing protein [Agromyces mediolanus]
MRLWLAEHERRPDPAPARADARKALLVGTIAWLVALGVVLAFGEGIDPRARALLVPTTVIGAALGVVGIAAVQLLRRRQSRSSSSSS